MSGAFAKEPDFLCPLLLALVVLVLFLSGAPTGDAFSWPDAPRHALTGAFVLDLLRDMPLHDPVSYAYNYYAKYPALVILFYPPLFYFFLAPFYAVFGVSQTSALIAEFVCYAALAAGGYRLARFWLEPVSAFGAALILVVAPEIAYWGRQVMLEIPSFALLAWSAVFFVRYLRESRVTLLYFATALAVLAMYTKMTTLFIFPVYVAVLFQHRGLSLLKDRHAYVIAGLTTISLLPLVVMSLKFGQANIQSVSGIPDERVSRTQLSGWVWYARQIPSQIGWPTLLAAVAGVVLSLRERDWRNKYALLWWWLAIGYMFFSAIALKEARHSVLLLLPLAIFAAVGVGQILINRQILANAAVLSLGVAALCVTVLTRPVGYVAGYDQVADYIAKTAPKNSAVVFSGYRDGSFIFAMRTHEERRDLSIVRSTKLLLNISVRRSLGVQQKLLSKAQIAKMLDDLGIQLVIAQPGFWTDLEAMRRFEDVLHSRHFRELRRFAMRSNFDAEEKELVVYRNLGHVARGPIPLSIDIPMINRTVSGTIGNSNSR